jgi:hypothetical protein
VLTGKGKKTQMSGEMPEGTRVFDDLAAAVDAVLSEST